MSVERTLRLTFGYDESTQKRNYTFSGVASSVAANVKSRVNAINESLASGTSGGLDEFFVDDEGNYLVKIEEAVYTTTTEEPLDLGV